MHQPNKLFAGFRGGVLKAACSLQTLCVVACLIAASSPSDAAPASPEDRYIATRDADIKKLKALYDDKKTADTATQAEVAMSADLEAKMRALLGEPGYKGFGPAKLNLDTLYEGDEGFGMLDGLRFDAETGMNGEKSDTKHADGTYVVPKAHILVTSQTLFARWLRAHKEWWGKGLKNVSQQAAAALKEENFYTQAISTDAAVVKFNVLPVVRPDSTTFVFAMLGGRTQDSLPDAADEVFVSALANGKLYVAYGAIDPQVEVAACQAMRADDNKKAQDAYDALQQKRIDKKAYDALGDLRQKGEDAFKRCFVQRAPQRPAFAEATKQAQSLLEAAIGH